MSTVEKSIRLYAWKTNYHTFRIVQGEMDSRRFNIQLFSTTIPVTLHDCHVCFYAVKPDGKKAYLECEILDADTGLVSVELSAQVCAVDGTVDCWIQVVSDAGTDLRFEGMNIEVSECDLNEAAESSNDFGFLTTAIAEMRPATARANEAAARANASADNADRATAESDAQTAKAKTATTNAEKATTAANTAKSNADKATASANQATTAAEQAKSNADAAAQEAINAANAANTAKTNADKATSSANTAAKTANDAASAANTARQAIDGAVVEAQTAVSNANKAVQAANSVVQGATDAATEANAAAIAASIAASKAEEAAYEANDALDLALAQSEQLVAQELAKRGQLKPEFANSYEELVAMGNPAKLYVLPDGYIYGYYRTSVPGGPLFTNVAKPNDVNWKEGYRLNSSSQAVACDVPESVCSNIFNAKPGDTIYVSGMTIGSQIGNINKCVAYLANGNAAWEMYLSSSGTTHDTYAKDRVSVDTETGVESYTLYLNNAGVQYTYKDYAPVQCRISGILTGKSSDVIITVNQPIEYSEPTVGYQWANTGHAFVPSDYEDRIIQAENNIADHSDRIAVLEEKAENSDTVVDLPDYWKTEIEERSETVKFFQECGGINSVCFAYAGDTHIPDCDTGKTQRLGRVMAGMLDACDIPFSVICGDVGTRSSCATEELFVETHKQLPVHLAPLWGTDRLLLAMGNHDGCYGDSSGYYKKQFSPERMWQLYYRQHSLDFKKVFSSDGLYFYVDNISQKTRFIILNSNFAGPYSVKANGEATNNRFSKSCYGQAQLDWLAKEALNMPEGYSAVLFAHVPPNIKYTTDKAQFIGIVNAFCNKTSFSGSYTSGVNGWDNSSVNVNFASAKGDIVAMFTGHVHGDSIDTTTMARPIITILSAGAGANEPYKETAPTRTANTATETNFDVVTIDKTARTIYLTRVGAGADREVKY